MPAGDLSERDMLTAADALRRVATAIAPRRTVRKSD
jgi:hypothetical protein